MSGVHKSLANASSKFDFDFLREDGCRDVIENYIVNKIEFNTNLGYSGEKRDIDFDIDSRYKFSEDKFILELSLNIYPKAEEHDYPFAMFIEVIGLFEVEGDEDESVKIEFAERNSIAILFPYLRALVSSFTPY